MTRSVTGKFSDSISNGTGSNTKAVIDAAGDLEDEGGFQIVLGDNTFLGPGRSVNGNSDVGVDRVQDAGNVTNGVLEIDDAGNLIDQDSSQVTLTNASGERTVSSVSGFQTVPTNEPKRVEKREVRLDSNGDIRSEAPITKFVSQGNTKENVDIGQGQSVSTGSHVIKEDTNLTGTYQTDFSVTQTAEAENRYSNGDQFGVRIERFDPSRNAWVEMLDDDNFVDDGTFASKTFTVFDRDFSPGDKMRAISTWFPESANEDKLLEHSVFLNYTLLEDTNVSVNLN
jgi:hypothetical protein